MKRIILPLVMLLLVSLSASASVTLTNPYIMGGVTAPNITCMGYDFDWNTQTMSVRNMFGTAIVSNNKDTGFTVAQSAPIITNTLYLSNGVWIMNIGSDSK